MRWECGACKGTFTKKSGLERHLARKHPDEWVHVTNGLVEADMKVTPAPKRGPTT